MKNWPSGPPPAWRVFITITKSSMLLLTTSMKRGNDAMLFDFLRGVGGSTQIFCAMSLGPLALSRVGSIMTDSYDNRTPPHKCKWGHLIQLYIFPALSNVT